jgi:ATP-dependent RNA helicase DDX55/SPB4
MIQYSQAKIIIFFNTCASVDFYTKVLRDFLTREDDEIYVEGIHGKLKNKKRNRILQIFTERKNGCLFATDVVSRGIDFDHVDFIVQVDPPEDPDNYIHRIGRTARVNNSGTAILLI